MPAKIIKKRTARKIRKSIEQRSKQQATGRKGMQPATSTDAIIADSISSLRLKPKGGAEVFLLDEENTSVEKIYKDLKASYIRVAEMLKVEPIYFKALEQLTMRVQLDWVITKFRSLLPYDFDFEIRQENYKTWCFVIFKELDSNNQYNVVFVKHVLEYLKKNNPRLHVLFIQFLKILINKIHVDGWWNSYADQFMEQEVDEFAEDEDRDESYYQKLLSMIDTYRNGYPAKYAMVIRHEGYIDPLLLAKKLKSLRKEKELTQVLIEGCELLAEPYSVLDFGYAPNDMMNDAGLRFEYQTSIGWTCEDAFFNYHEDALNSEAQEGVFPPTIFKVVDKNIQESDFEWLKKGQEWPVHLCNLFYDLNNVFRKYERNS